MKKIFSSVVLLVALSLLCQNVSFADNAVDKLGRGLVNTATGWVEIFSTPNRYCEEKGLVDGCMYGIPAGIFRAIGRTCIGVYETVTFPFPWPPDYEPIMQPEFVIDSSIFD